jgi:hypothetical protein
MQRCRRSARVAVLVLSGLLASEARAADPAAQLQRAIELYGEGQFQEAAKLLEAARGETREPKLLGKILLQLGITYGVLGDEVGAKKAFEAALDADPTVSLDPESVKPKVAALFKAAKGAPKGTLSVRSTPPGAEVLVDGQSVGKTPLAGVRVLAGQRSVEVALAGHYSDRRTIAVSENQEARFETTLAARPSPVRPGTHPFAASLHVGPAIAVKGEMPVMTALSEEFVAHFARRASGFFLGVALTETFGSKDGTFYDAYGFPVVANVGFFYFTAGLKLGWDIQPSSRVGLYLTPLVLGGYSYLRQAVDNGRTATLHAGFIEPAFELKLIIVDRLVLALRPFGLEFLVGKSCEAGTTDPCIPDGYLMRYHLSLGLGGSF